MPLIYNIKNSGHSSLSVWKIEEPEHELMDRLTFTQNMKTSLNRISNSEKRLEWLASRILIQNMAGCAPCIAYQKNGSPLLNQSTGYLSISHTKGYAAVVFSSRHKCGIDIEYPSDRISRLAERFINNHEAGFIPSLQCNEYHSIIWCAKEALYKMSDQPGMSFKNHFEVAQFKLADSGAFNATIKWEDTTHSYQLHYRATSDYYLVWHW